MRVLLQVIFNTVLSDFECYSRLYNSFPLKHKSVLLSDESELGSGTNIQGERIEMTKIYIEKSLLFWALCRRICRPLRSIKVCVSGRCLAESR